ncbi:MAG: hypothetical protein ACI9P5_001470, partial [Saprospiraceae bacterium]
MVFTIVLSQNRLCPYDESCRGIFIVLRMIESRLLDYWRFEYVRLLTVSHTCTAVLLDYWRFEYVRLLTVSHTCTAVLLDYWRFEYVRLLTVSHTCTAGLLDYWR